MFEGIRSLFNRILNPVEKTEPAPQQQQQTTNNQDMNEVIIIDVLAGKDEENRKFVGNDLLLNEMGKLKFSRYEDEERERPLQTIGEPTAYKVKSGDTLSHIADNHGVDLDAIIDANPKINPNMLKVGQELVIPAPVVKVAKSDMEVDPKKTKEYESAIQQMMKEKGVTDTKQIKELSALITKKAIEQKVDPVLIAGIVGQEVDFRYLNDNIYGKNGKGMMQLTSVSIEDLYRNECPSYYIGSKDKLAEIKKKYPTANSLWNAICKKENYELNLEVGIIIFKGKLELDYIRNPQSSEKQHIEKALETYNGHPKFKNQYWRNIIANYNNHKVA